jgi:ATP-dependent DNA ligase
MPYLLGLDSEPMEAKSLELFRTELVVEITYDQVADGRFRHGTMLRRWRPDKAPKQCARERLHRSRDPALWLSNLILAIDRRTW